MKECPLCGCTVFYLRDPEDEYELTHFDATPQGPVFRDELDPESELQPSREVFCDHCAWRGTLEQFIGQMKK
jgi:hypothetical protein